MNFLIDFLHQEVPKSGGRMPAYYRKALFISEVILVAYFVATIALLFISTGIWLWPPVIITTVTIFCVMDMDHMSPRLNLALFATLIGAWLAWFVYRFGWSAGSPNILVPILAMAYFNIYEPPLGKIFYFLGLVAFRVLLFSYSLKHTPVGVLDSTDSLTLQIVNSVIPLLMLAIDFILFSSSIQATERKLRLHNQELSKEAGTDPLTQLPNRRAMLDTMDNFMKNAPNERFSVAIADIDFFKKVNDTYGHNCGDYTLKTLAALFKEKAGENYTVCRWGGEEFCFFMPNKNLDEAGAVMFDLCISVKKMPLEFGDNRFNITITIGVEEYDYMSPVDVILERADQKLYRGKISGRNQVVM